jgi:hypothetical protein
MEGPRAHEGLTQNRTPKGQTAGGLLKGQNAQNFRRVNREGAAQKAGEQKKRSLLNGQAGFKSAVSQVIANF